MKKAIDFINSRMSFVVAAHRNPDGDAAGATLGLVLVLRALGKEAAAYNADGMPDNTLFLPGARETVTELASLPEAEAVIVLDSGDAGRPGAEFLEWTGDRPVLNIDHHVTNTGFGDANWVDHAASSTGEMIARLAAEMEVPLDAGAALCLFTAILTDTGSFSFSNASPETFRIAAGLVERGARPEVASARYYHSKPPGYLLLLNRFLAGFEYNSDKTMADASLSRKDYEDAGSDSSVSETFVNILMDVEGVAAAAFYREVGADSWKVSMRSRGQADVAVIARGLGGGGHPNAAGCSLAGSLGEVKRVIRAGIGEAIAAVGKGDT